MYRHALNSQKQGKKGPRYLATNRTGLASLHPLVYTTKVVMVVTLRDYPWIFNTVLCQQIFQMRKSTDSTQMIRKLDENVTD